MFVNNRRFGTCAIPTHSTRTGGLRTRSCRTMRTIQKKHGALYANHWLVLAGDGTPTRPLLPLQASRDGHYGMQRGDLRGRQADRPWFVSGSWTLSATFPRACPHAHTTTPLPLHLPLPMPLRALCAFHAHLRGTAPSAPPSPLPATCPPYMARKDMPRPPPPPPLPHSVCLYHSATANSGSSSRHSV